jgi:hypothetical protein
MTRHDYSSGGDDMRRSTIPRGVRSIAVFACALSNRAKFPYCVLCHGPQPVCEPLTLTVGMATHLILIRRSLRNKPMQANTAGLLSRETMRLLRALETNAGMPPVRQRTGQAGATCSGWISPSQLATKSGWHEDRQGADKAPRPLVPWFPATPASGEDTRPHRPPQNCPPIFLLRLPESPELHVTIAQPSTH